jgi:hypothetical protein
MKLIFAPIRYIIENYPDSMYNIVAPLLIAILTIFAVIGGYQNIEYRKGVEKYNEQTQKIDLLVAKIQNGNRQAFNELDSMSVEVKLSDGKLYEYVIERKKFAEGVWDLQVDRPRVWLHPEIDGIKNARLSSERIYELLVLEDDILTDMQFEELIEEASNWNNKCLAKTLFDIGISHKNINRSIMAVKGLNYLLSFSEEFSPPYGDKYPNGSTSLEAKTHRKMRGPGELPNFPTLRKWWNEIGSKREEFDVSMENVMDEINQIPLIDTENVELINAKQLYFYDLFEKQFGLQRALGSYGYLCLFNDSNFKEAEERLAYPGYEYTAEPLIHLSLAYIKVTQKNYPEAQVLIDQCIKRCGLERTQEVLGKYSKFSTILNCKNLEIPNLLLTK